MSYNAKQAAVKLEKIGTKPNDVMNYCAISTIPVLSPLTSCPTTTWLSGL